MNDSLERLLETLNKKIAKQDFEKLEKVDLPAEATFEKYLEFYPPALTVREKIWYNYLPQVLKGAAILLHGTVAGNAADLLLQIKDEDLMNASQINITTNILGFLLFVLEPVRSYLASQPFSWFTFVTCVLGAGVAYFTGKSTLSAQKGN